MLLPTLIWWGLWCLTALKQGGTASAAFLPLSVERLFQDFRNIIEESRETLGTDRFETSVDISKLPANYHNEEKQHRKVGNATVYSHREIHKVTDNHTGDMMFSEKTVTSIEQEDAHPAEKEKKQEASQEAKSLEADRPTPGLRFFKLGLPQPRPRLSFLIIRLPHHTRSEEQNPEPNWLKEEPVSDRRHRLLAIRNGLLAAPRPIKKKVLFVTPNRSIIPRKRHFFFFWRKITCQDDKECCLGYLCVWGQCREGVSRGESGTRCDPHREECAQGLCCATSDSLLSPLCTPYPKEGEPCQIPRKTLLGLMGWNNLEAFAKPKHYCPCAQGLMCRTERYVVVSTCEKPDNSADISSLGQQRSLFQPILLRQEKEDAYYDDSAQDDQFAIVNLPRDPYSMDKIDQSKDLSEKYDKNSQFPGEKEMANSIQPDFQELKQLASEMGQYFGTNFY
nr:dickkopf-like protein 1 [Pogona vitticeps]